MSMFATSRPSFSPADRREIPTPSVPHPDFDLVQIAPQYPSNTPQASYLGGSDEIWRLEAAPGRLDCPMSTTVPSSHTPNIRIHSQATEDVWALANVPKMGGNCEVERPKVVPEVGSMSRPMSPLSPPRHARPLYHSIQLPGFDEESLLQPQPILETPLDFSWSLYDGASPELPSQANTLGLYSESVRLDSAIRRAPCDAPFMEVRTTIDVEPSLRSGGLVHFDLHAAPAGEGRRARYTSGDISSEWERTIGQGFFL